MAEQTGDTRQRVLESAAEIFAEKGFNRATVQDICAAAQANIASVNYHFGSKENLYNEVWRYTLELKLKAYPLDEGCTEKSTPEEKFGAYIRAQIRAIFDPGSPGFFSKLMLREMSDQSFAHQQIFEEGIRPMAARLEGIVAALLGGKASEKQITLCMSSVVPQYLSYNFRRQHPHKDHKCHRFFVGDNPTAAEQELLARHITAFSLAGLKASKTMSEEYDL